ncbi:MAG: formate/nitrite transporter family protein [Gammaproteobacteria bacterium]|nr:formate/nitrite transporter family protein [Gammaproteobacteria bacterium]NVK87831.1 formate/nitrite transporter family protein [Gammaproteobacteria bacterium]
MTDNTDPKILLSDGELAESETPKTERSTQREEEERQYSSVIVKRVDESLRHPDDILERTIEEGQEQLNRSFLSLLISSAAASMILCFTVMAVAVMMGITQEVATSSAKFWVALVYPLGFILTILSGTQLFTEHTATAVYPVLDKRAAFPALLRLWATVILGNLIGAVIGAGFLVAADNVIQAKESYITLGHHLTDLAARDLLISSLLAGWLMALGAWLLRSSSNTVAQIVCIFIVTFLIGLGGLHHSIAGSVEILVAAMVSDHFSLFEIVRFISLALVGNLIGGSVFVGALNYTHIRRTQ